MKIAIIAPITWPIPPKGYGPWEQVVYTLAEELTKNGHQVVVFATKKTHGNFHIKYFLDSPLSLSPALGEAKHMFHITEAFKNISKNDFDIIHNNLGATPVAIFQTIKKYKKIPMVTTLHGFDKYSNFLYTKYSNENYVSISDALRDQNPELNYISTVYNGIDFDYFKPENKVKENFLFVGARISKEKGIHNAITLAKKTKTKLFIAGPVHEPNYYHRYIVPEVDGENIIFLGTIPHQKIKEYLCKALAYVSLIEWDEPFGLSAGEAIACGTPVIATKRGSMPELIKNGISGILVNNVEESIKRFSEIKKIPPKKCREFGKNIFSLKKMAEDYLKTYQKILLTT